MRKARNGEPATQVSLDKLEFECSVYCGISADFIFPSWREHLQASGKIRRQI